MNEQQKEELFLKEVKNALDTSTENLGEDLCSRLAKSRHAALESRTPPRSRSLSWFRYGFAGFALAALIWTAAIFFLPERNEIVANVPIEDLEIVTSGASPDFYRDMDFYLWLSTKKDRALQDARRMVFLQRKAPGRSY